MKISRQRLLNESQATGFRPEMLDEGDIEPSLLTSDSAMVECIRSHPLLQWKALNGRQHKGR